MGAIIAYCQKIPPRQQCVIENLLQLLTTSKILMSWVASMQSVFFGILGTFDVPHSSSLFFFAHNSCESLQKYMELVLVSLKFIRNKLMYTRKKMVLYFSWQEYVRLVYKKGLFLVFFRPQKSLFFQFDRTTDIQFTLKDPRMPFIWLYFFMRHIIQTYLLLLCHFQVNQH